LSIVYYHVIRIEVGLPVYNSYNCFYVPIDPPDKLTLLPQLKEVADWKKLATFLLDDVNGSIVPAIERSNHYVVEDCRDAMINKFLKSGDKTWEKVIESLKLAGYKSLAKRIEDKL